MASSSSFFLELRYKIYFTCSTQPRSQCKAKLHRTFNWKNEQAAEKTLGQHICVPLIKSEQRLDKERRKNIENRFRLNADLSSQSVVSSITFF